MNRNFFALLLVALLLVVGCTNTAEPAIKGTPPNTGDETSQASAKTQLMSDACVSRELIGKIVTLTEHVITRNGPQLDPALESRVLDILHSLGFTHVMTLEEALDLADGGLVLSELLAPGAEGLPLFSILEFSVNGMKLSGILDSATGTFLGTLQEHLGEICALLSSVFAR